MGRIHGNDEKEERGTEMRILTNGRTNLADYFMLSGIRESKNLSHHPFIVFNEQPSTDTLVIDIVDNASKLLAYADEVKVMAQWGGRWSSDFFQFTVGDLRKYIAENPKADYQII